MCGTFALDPGKLLGLLGISGLMSLHRRSKDLGQPGVFLSKAADPIPLATDVLGRTRKFLARTLAVAAQHSRAGISPLSQVGLRDEVTLGHSEREEVVIGTVPTCQRDYIALCRGIFLSYQNFVG